ncbi:MAG: LamG domain-containing protein [Phycisphaeraceae bacterium]|nr:LamG domain-containing protein [Phycisphaeraceae bacterium]
MKIQSTMFCTSVAVLFAAGSASAATIVHQWSFDGNLNDSSGNGNTGVLTNVDGVTPATPVYVAGQSGQAISIAANEGVLNNAATGLPTTAATDSWSMNVWLKLDNPPASLNYFGGFGGNTNNVGPGFDGTARGYLNFGAGVYFWGSSRDLNSGPAYIVDGQWHMYTITYNADTSRMITYLDGAGVGSGDVALEDAPANVQIGNLANMWNSNFVGSVDEFTIWSGELAFKEVVSLVPEPSSLALLGLGGLVMLRRRR